MHTSNIIFSFGVFTPFTSAILTKRIFNDPVDLYLQEMCSPNFNITGMYESGEWDQNYFAKFANSPFPCEKTQYLQSACGANDTTEIDFLAEQQCLCKGTYFVNLEGCDACYIAHGYTQKTPTELAVSSRSISSAECSASPPTRSFNDLLVEFMDNYQSYEERTSSIINAKPKTLGSDGFPSKTEVSNYWKTTVAAIPGEITGSATGRASVYPNPNGDFTESLDPAKTPASGGFAQGTGTERSTVITTEKTPVAGGNTATASSVATTTTASSSGSTAARSEFGVSGGILGMVLGLVALL